MIKNRKIKIHPYVLIILTFLAVILLGTICLMLPWAVKDGVRLTFVDALFMSTSSVCVTGLSVVTPATKLSLFGKIVMAIMMEIGGLSFLTIAVCFFAVIGGKIGIGNRYLLREALNQKFFGGNCSFSKAYNINILYHSNDRSPIELSFFDVILSV